MAHTVKILSGPRAGQVIDVDAEAKKKASTTGNRDEDAQIADTEDSEATQASNAGRQAQSTDHMNQY